MSLFMHGVRTTNDLREHREREDSAAAMERRDQQRERFGEPAVRYHHRITWVNGVAHVQRCPVGGTYDRNGEIVRVATDDDRAAMIDGRISYDPETHPGQQAWACHVAAGGD